MTTFLIGLAILIIGGILYGKFSEKVFGPDDRPTPAIYKADGVDYVVMPQWKNLLINLLNIAGTGPIIGAIQGALFGPIALLIIPVGCVFGGAFHDYMCGMISMRSGGKEMTDLMKDYTTKDMYFVYTLLVWVLLLLVGTVFIYTPGDMISINLCGRNASQFDVWTWVIYGGIFLYYFAATLFPIDKIIGKVYPIFGMLLLFSAIGIFCGFFFKDMNISEVTWANWKGIHPDKAVHLIPMFFLTVACGIVSGFHSTQCALTGRCVRSEREGRGTFYTAMIMEGFIAMVWAAATIAVYNSGIVAVSDGPMAVISGVSKYMLGSVGGMIAILGIIVLPITSGDTALRGLRLMVAERFGIEQKSSHKRLAITGCILLFVAVFLVISKFAANGFTILWRYFAWANQTMAVFAFAMITIYLFRKGKPWFIAIIPGMFYMFVTSAYLLHEKIGFNIPYKASLWVAGGCTAIYTVYTLIRAAKVPLPDEAQQ